MAISYPLSMPTTPQPNVLAFGGVNVTAKQSSPYTAKSQVYQWDGDYWRANISLPAMSPQDFREWMAFILSLKGQTGTFTLGDPKLATPRGFLGGTPLVNGASQTGSSLVTDGWTPSITNILRKGDLIALSNRMHMVLTDTSSDGSGNATLDIWPMLRESPADNASITTNNCKGLFRLDGEDVTWSIDFNGFYDLQFGAIEAI